MTSIFDLTEDQKSQPLIGIAKRVATGEDGRESWDLTVVDLADNVLSTDHFNFTGRFSDDGLNALVSVYLAPAGLVYSGAWVENEDKTEWSNELHKRSMW